MNRAFGDRYLIVAVTAIVIAILMGVLLARIDREISQAERMQFQFRLAELQAALLVKQAAYVARDELAEIAELDGGNPIAWLRLDERDQSYLGEQSLDSAAGEVGRWVFDPQRRVIAYMPRSRDWLQGNSAEDGFWLQFQVVTLWSYEGVEKNSGQEGSQKREAIGLRLKPLQEVRYSDL